MQISMEKSWATIGFWGYLISRGDLGPRLLDSAQGEFLEFDWNETPKTGVQACNTFGKMLRNQSTVGH